MSTINKLQIAGIRSFSPDDPQVIAFRKPLTLIVGSNGSGKTTIIECIKMALTGELPPDANRGKNFIHDPKVQANTETKAKIMMQFQTVNAKKCTVTRQFTLQYKTRKENAVPNYSMSSTSLSAVGDDGKKRTISQRSIDVDKAVPQHMGISKAILENVIFVHQEDANWPLKESKVLKEKFDDIFSATRYSKALDAIKKLRKEKMDEVKDQKIQLAEKKARVEAKKDILKRKRQQETQIAQLQQQLVECADEFDENKRKHNELIGLQSELELLDSQIKGLKATRDEMVRNKEQLRETIDQNGEEYLEEDSDDDLRKWRDQLSRKSDTANGKMLAAENEIEQKRVEIEEKDNFLRNSARDKILLEREVEEHNANIMAREKRANQIAEQMGLVRGSDVDETHENISRAVREHEEAFRLLKEKHRQELDVQRRKSSDARNQVRQSEQKLDELRTREQQEREQLHQLTKALQRGASVSSEQLERDKMALKDAEDSQKIYRQETKRLTDEIREKAKDEASIKAKKEDVDEELSNMVSQQDAITRLNTLRDQMNSKQAQVDEDFDQIQAKVQGHSNGRTAVSSADDVERFVHQHVKDCEHAARDAKHDFMRLSSNKNQIDERIRELEGQEVVQNDAIAALQKKIDKAKKVMKCEDTDESWNDIVGQREKILKQAELEAVRFRASGPVFEEFLEKAAKMRGPCHGCPVCDRPFTDTQEYKEFEQKIRRIVDRVHTGDGAFNDEEIQAAKKKLDFCKSKQQTWDDLQRLRNIELPKIRDEIDRKRREHDNLLASEGAAKQRSDDAGLAEVQAKQLEDAWQRHQRDRSELVKLKREVGNAESNVLGVNAGRGMEAVHNEAERLNRELAEVSSKVRSLYEQQNLNDKNINKLGVQIIEKQKKISETLRQAESRKQDEKERQRLEKSLPELAQQIADLSETIGDAQLVVPTIEAEEQDLIKRQRDTETDHEHRLDQSRSNLGDLSRMRNAIEEFRREDRQGQLNELCVKVEQREGDRIRLKDEISKLEQDLASLRKSNADQAGMLRNMQDVLNFRAKKADIEEINEKINAKNHKKAEITPHPDWERELSQLSKIVHRGLTERGELQGSKNQCEDELRRLNEQLKSYHKADEEYRTTLITVKTLELGSADLEKYHQALDKALVTYHAEKMQEVNEIAKFLWGQTYKGQDIESIEIRADETGTKSYNYRLLMRKGNAELDMKGRCSAGQKVLAALVIRLALAETFCLNCGILALDEPTTNLDVENIKSLCHALKEIITQRKRQKNFQLIIITHDEDFMSELARVDGICDTYYRVSKNESTQTSQIEEQDLRATF